MNFGTFVILTEVFSQNGTSASQTVTLIGEPSGDVQPRAFSQP